MRIVPHGFLAPLTRRVKGALWALRPRRVFQGSVDSLTLSVAAKAPRPARLPAEKTYRALLERQFRGEIVDVKHLTRPGVVGWAADSRHPWSVVQGAGRYEKIPASGYFDAFVDVRAPLPPGAIPLERDVPGSLVYAANILSSRGQAGANPELVGFVTDGKTFQRALFPVRSLGVTTSKVLHDIGKLEKALANRFGPAVLQRALPRGYADLAPVDRLVALQRVAAPLSGL
jgi:hypothetical protein